MNNTGKMNNIKPLNKKFEIIHYKGRFKLPTLSGLYMWAVFFLILCIFIFLLSGNIIKFRNVDLVKNLLVKKGYYKFKLGRTQVFRSRRCAPDENGKYIMTKKGKIVRSPITDKKGNPITDEKGNPITYRTDDNGNPITYKCINVSNYLKECSNFFNGRRNGNYAKYMLRGMQIYCPFKLKKTGTCTNHKEIETCAINKMFGNKFYALYWLHISGGVTCLATLIFLILLILILLQKKQFRINIFIRNVRYYRYNLGLLIFLLISIFISILVISLLTLMDKKIILEMINICDDATPANPADLQQLQHKS